MSSNIPKTVPFLPGYVFSDPKKQSHHKTQQFSVDNGALLEKTNYVREELDQELLDSMRCSTPVNLTYGKRQAPENEYIPRIQPPWLKYDRKVLRFSGFFQESVCENPTENYRVRPCLIYYYLADQTIHITEPRVVNSGMMQGIFVKRQKIPKKLGSSDEYYSYEDLNLSININFFERIFRITDCDNFTRNFYSEMGFGLNDKDNVPIDQFQTRALTKEVKISPPDTKEYKEYFEVKLGGGHPNNGLSKFIKNDRQVLSFNLMWNDLSLEGQLNFYVLNYYLADDSLEVKEQNKSNSGKDPYPLMLKRGKLPKRPILTHYPGMTLQKEEYYGPSDLVCGNLVTVYQRECLIYDCDEFTKKWYQENFNHTQVPIPFEEKKPQKVVQQIPPYTGYGTLEDSLGSVYNLQAKPPKIDLNKMFTSDQYILRFESRLISDNRENNDRKFIISFFCGNDTIKVFLAADKNSGIWGGTFQEREKFRKENGEYYTQKDFQIGNIVTLNVYKFQLMKADEFTHKYMQDHPNVFPGSDVTQVVSKLQSYSNRYNNYDEFLVDFVRKVDRNRTGAVSFVEFTEGLNTLKFDLTYQEQYTLVRNFEHNNQWKLSVPQLFKALGGK